MASNPESVADIVKEMREFGDHCAAFGGAYSPERWDKLCNRIEAAHRRRPTPVDDDLLKMARDIDRLNAKLKVAEDALEKCVKVQCSGDDDSISCDECDLSCDGRCAQWMAKNALAAIRKEGGAK